MHKHSEFSDCKKLKLQINIHYLITLINLNNKNKIFSNEVSFKADDILDN